MVDFLIGGGFILGIVLSILWLLGPDDDNWPYDNDDEEWEDWEDEPGSKCDDFINKGY